MAKKAWLIHTMALDDDASTAAAVRAGKRAFDRENELASLGEFGLENANIGDVERDRDQRKLGHRKPSLQSQANHAAIVDHLDPHRNPHI